MIDLVTGAAGFIGFDVSRLPLQRGERVVGIGDLNDDCRVQRERDRLRRLDGNGRVTFHAVDIADRPARGAALGAALGGTEVRRVVLPAAQAGVRNSMNRPEAGIRSDPVGHFDMLEFCRSHDVFERMACASSGSVYGGGEKLPFVDRYRGDHAAHARA